MTPEGWNQREEDFLSIFDHCIDRIIEYNPDLVIHAGDLFHIVRPTNRVIARAAKGLLRLSRAKIPTVVISGNHDTPKNRSVGSVFQIMDIIPNINYIYRGVYERVEIGDAVVHAAPHCLSQESLEAQLERAVPDPGFKYNILVLHGVVASIPEFSMNEFAEQFLADSYFPKFDYVALGHYHKYARVASNCYYSGSTERLSFSEAGHDKGFIEVNLPGPEVRFIKVPAREMFIMKPIDASGYDGERLRNEIVRRVQESRIEGSIARLDIKNLPSHLKSELNRDEIRELTKEAFHFKINPEKKEDETVLAESISAIGKLENEFESFIMRTVVEEKLNKDELIRRGIEYLRKVREGQS